MPNKAHIDKQARQYGVEPYPTDTGNPSAPYDSFYSLYFHD